MRSRLMIGLRDERGIAMIVVIMAMVIVTVIGSALVVSGIRDLDSSTSVSRASSSLGIAEAGVQHAMKWLRTFGPFSHATSKCVADDSPDGRGQFTNPDDPVNSAPVYDPANFDPKVHCGPMQVNVGTGEYLTHVIIQDPVVLPHDRQGVYQVISVGRDRKGVAIRPGIRTVEQNLRIRALDIPFALFSVTGVDAGGTPIVYNESMYVGGDIKFRGNISFNSDASCLYAPYTGCDTAYGWKDGDINCGPMGPVSEGYKPCPSAVHATGVIHEGNDQGGGPNQPIHPPPQSRLCKFPYDRDSKGTDYGSIWPPTSPAAHACPAGMAGKEPPYFFAHTAKGGSFFDSTMYPFDPDRLTDPELYRALEDIARSQGTYCVHDGASTVLIPASTGGCGGQITTRIDQMRAAGDKFLVIYVKMKNSNVALKIQSTGWGAQGDPPFPESACDGSNGIVVVENGNMKYDNSKNWWGAMFVPQGSFNAEGGGSGWIIGTVYAKTMGNTGNHRFILNNCWLNTLPGPYWSVTRLRWHESDR